MRKILLLVAMSIGLGGPALAGDLELFEGLIPGTPLSDEEMAGIYGKGIEINVVVDPGALANLTDLQINDASVDNSTQTNNNVITGNAGIPQISTIAGDGNSVLNYVSITVLINSVVVDGVSGSSLSITNSGSADGVNQLFGP